MNLNINNTIEKEFGLEFNEYEMILRDYAMVNGVPVIGDEGLAYLETIIALYKPKRILEIGTAIGYSTERMARICGSEVISIERDKVMYDRACMTMKDMNISNVKLIYKDALDAYPDVCDMEFDMLFIDAAKAQYKRFFELYTPLLKKGGIVVCDNMGFHGFLEGVEIKTRALRGLIRKIKDYHEYLISNTDYKTNILNIGDGMSVSIKK